LTGFPAAAESRMSRMPDYLTIPERDFYNKLKWLMFFRVLFTSLLLGSTIILQLGKSPSPLDRPLLVLYGMIVGIFILSFIYAVSLKRVKRLLVFTYIQISVDTFVVTLVIFVTGSFSSIFSFLYLVVITYSSLFLYQRGSLIIASFCTIQYLAMVSFEFSGFINPYLVEGMPPASGYPWSQVFYKVAIITAACFAVAYLSGVLAEQVRKTKIELDAMEAHLKRVEKMAYMGRMASNMAHEIKNPMASLAGAIQLLREDIPYHPDQDRLMQIVMRETNRLSDLVTNFLVFGKPSVGKVEAFELDSALRETVGIFEKNDACRGRIAIAQEYMPGIWVEMDPLRLRQVLWNLLLNASEAIEGAGDIKIELFRIRPDSTVIQISDSGCGILPKMVNSIFDPFFTTKPNGTGLGLSIVHSILESYGSRLDVNSQVGKGTTVIIKLRSIPKPRANALKDNH